MTQLSALPVVDLKDDPSACIRQVNRTRHPVAITDHGERAAVLMSAADYDALIEKLELLQDIGAAERELAEGLAIPHENAKAHALAQLGR
ncbi:MAG: antitoxin YefM [Rhodothermales bacterium]|jgi:antitoxin YefM